MTTWKKDYEKEEHRRISFVTWSGNISASLLAKSGFYFYQEPDVVQCFVCGVKIHSWEDNDVPDTEHFIHSPSCIFMKEKTRINPIILYHGLVSFIKKQKEIKERLDKIERWVTTPIWGCDEVDLSSFACRTQDLEVGSETSGDTSNREEEDIF